MMRGLLVLCLFVIGESIFDSIILGESLTLTKEQCVKSIKKIDTVSGFLDLSNKLIRDNYAGIGEQENALINKCLHSVNGQEDIKALRRIVDQAATIHSVCEQNFINQLLQFDIQFKNNVSLGKISKRKQNHRLIKFFRLFAGQVALTCKKSLASKLHSAEEDNHELRRAVDKINELSAKNTVPLDVRKNKNLSSVTRKLFSLAIKYAPSVFNKVENIVLFESLKPTPDARFFLTVTLNTDIMLEEFMKTKRACKLVDKYSQSSIYTISRLAWLGYLAQNASNSLDRSLSEDERVQKWINAIQYCQGVLIAEVKVDLEQESLLKLSEEVLNDDQILIVNLARKKKDQTMSGDVEAYRYEQTDYFIEFDIDLKCYTHSMGLGGWLMKRLGMGERLMAKYIKLSVLDESFKRSMLGGEAENFEKEVQFGGTSALFGHATNHIGLGANGMSTVAHHSYLGGSAHAQTGIIVAISIGTAFLIAFLMFLVAHLRNKHKLNANNEVYWYKTDPNTL